MEQWQKHYFKFVAVAALQAGIFVAYRVMVDRKKEAAKNALQKVAYSNFKPSNLHFVAEIDFSKHLDKLLQLSLEKSEDLDKGDTLHVQAFSQQGVLASIQKLQSARRGLYSLYVDFDSLLSAKLTVAEFTASVLKTLSLQALPITSLDAAEERFFHFVMLKDLPEKQDNADNMNDMNDTEASATVENAPEAQTVPSSEATVASNETRSDAVNSDPSEALPVSTPSANEDSAPQNKTSASAKTANVKTASKKSRSEKSVQSDAPGLVAKNVAKPRAKKSSTPMAESDVSHDEKPAKKAKKSSAKTPKSRAAKNTPVASAMNASDKSENETLGQLGEISEISQLKDLNIS